MIIGFDTMVAASLLNEELPVGLKPLATTMLGADNWGKGSQQFGLGELDSPKFKITPLYGEGGMGEYCARDTAYSHMLYEQQRDMLKRDYDVAKLMKYHCLPGMDAVLMMQKNGVWIDKERLYPRREELRAELIARQLELLEYVPEAFHPTASFTNDHFLRRWIFGDRPDGLGLTPIKLTPGGAPSVDADVLQQLAHPAMDILRTFNRTTKAIEFLDSWERFVDDDWRLHPNYNITGAVTGRRSCDNPNVMQTPRNKRLRSIFGAPPGWVWFDADYSMIEVRLAAWFAGEDTMLRLFAEGKDVYRYTAALIYGLSEAAFAALPVAEQKLKRQGAKSVVLGFLYGMGPKTFVTYARRTFGVVFTLEEAEQFRQVFFTTYPRLVAWHNRMRREAKKQGWVKSELGRVRHLSAIYSLDFKTRGKAERQAINSPVQGTGGDCTLAAMTSLYPELLAHPDEIMLVLDMHDMLAFQIREDVWERWAYRILTAMERLPSLERFGWNPPLRLKAEGEVGQHWGEGREITLEHFENETTVSSAWHEAA